MSAMAEAHGAQTVGEARGEEAPIAIVCDRGCLGNPARRWRAAVLARALSRGAAAVVGTEATLLPVAERARHWETLDAAAAVVFGCPA